MKRLTVPLLLRCFFRSYLVGAAYNPHGLQNIGFIYAIEPGLVALHGPGPALREARLRYAGGYNCHPFFTPMLLGAMLAGERSVAAGNASAALPAAVKDATANALSAIGDSFFNGALLNTWALGAGCLVLAGEGLWAFRLTAAAFLLLQAFKLGTFFLGVREGMAILRYMRKFDLINKGETVKRINALLLACFTWLALARGGEGAHFPLVWCGVVFYLLYSGWLVGRLHVPRIFAGIVLLLAAALLHAFGILEQLPALPFVWKSGG